MSKRYTGNEVLNLNNLFVGYNDKPVIFDIDFSLKRGKILGIVGNSGSGKSTLIRCLTGQLKPLKGSCRVAGFDVKKNPNKVQLRVGYVPQLENLSIYYDFNPLKNALFFGRNFGIEKESIESRCWELMETLGLGSEEYVKKPVEKLSSGEKKRTSIMIGLINNPAILFLDEPTTGLDPHLRIEVLNFLSIINRRFNTTIVIVSHDLEIVDYCDNVIIFNEGCMLDFGEPRDMVQSLPNKGKSFVVKFGSLPVDIDEKFERIKEISYFLHIGRNNYRFFLENESDKEVLFDKLDDLNVNIKENYWDAALFIDYFRIHSLFTYPEKTEKIKKKISN